MLLLIIMAAGILLGSKWFPHKYAKWNVRVQAAATAVLIFCMGVSLGSRSNFWEEITQMGLQSLVYAVLPIICSVILVYLLTKRFMKEK